jgi:hypothetical protein
MSKRRELAQKMRLEYQTAVRSVPPGGAGRVYRFDGLADAKRLQANLTLRYRFHILEDDEHQLFPAAFEFNGDRASAIVQQYVPTEGHVVTVPTEFIRDDGSLEVTIYNLYQPPPDQRFGSLNFDAEDFELLYQVGSFEANFLRAMLGSWIKLSFLAMLGIACATFLSFPVACLMSFTIFIAATMGPYMSIALQEYHPPATQYMDWSNIGLVIVWAFKSFIKGVAQALVFMLGPFGELRTTQSLVEGRLISWSSLARGFVVIGALWSGIGLAVGYLVFRGRQLAIYSGHG